MGRCGLTERAAKKGAGHSNFRTRLAGHSRPSSGHNQATFAWRLTVEAIEGRWEDLPTTRSALGRDSRFLREFIRQKERVTAMEFRVVAIPDDVDLALERLEAGVVVFGDPVALDVANLLQLAVEAEAEIVRRLLRPARRAPEGAEVGVVLDDDVPVAHPCALDRSAEADDIDEIRADVLHRHQAFQVAREVSKKAFHCMPATIGRSRGNQCLDLPPRAIKHRHPSHRVRELAGDEGSRLSADEESGRFRLRSGRVLLQLRGLRQVVAALGLDDDVNAAIAGGDLDVGEAGPRLLLVRPSVGVSAPPGPLCQL